jgi:hypothetical protein
VHNVAPPHAREVFKLHSRWHASPHVMQCPAYASTGSCAKGVRCPLAHGWWEADAIRKLKHPGSATGSRTSRQQPDASGAGSSGPARPAAAHPRQPQRCKYYFTAAGCARGDRCVCLCVCLCVCVKCWPGCAPQRCKSGCVCAQLYWQPAIPTPLRCCQCRCQFAHSSDARLPPPKQERLCRFRTLAQCPVSCTGDGVCLFVCVGCTATAPPTQCLLANKLQQISFCLHCFSACNCCLASLAGPIPCSLGPCSTTAATSVTSPLMRLRCCRSTACLPSSSTPPQRRRGSLRAAMARQQVTSGGRAMRGMLTTKQRWLP